MTTPKWVTAPAGADIHSVSGCVSEYFADYIPYWRHNGYWLFDRPSVMRELAAEHGLSLTDTTLFYYEVFEQEYDEDAQRWAPLSAELPFATDVAVPAAKQLEGFDVVSFSAGTDPECSPLSCNDLAHQVGVNDHCLLGSLERARQALEEHRFDRCEPGPFRIFAVYTVPTSER